MHRSTSSSSPASRTAPCDDTITERETDARFDPFERHILTLARLFMMTFHRPEMQTWAHAFEHAETLFGPVAGPVLNKAILSVVEQTRATRGSGFAYCDPYCPNCRPFLTNEERYLITVLHQLRRGRNNEAALQAMLLCEGRDTTAVMDRFQELIQRANGFDLFAPDCSPSNISR